MKKLILLVGPPASGKSTYSKTLDAVRISQDDMGKEAHLDAFKAALEASENIAVDRMNFNKEQRARYIKPALELGYEVEAVTFYFNEETCLERCLKREDHPTIKDEENAKSALNTFFSKFEYPSAEEGISTFKEIRQEPRYNPCIVVDVDNTIADGSHRQHFLEKGNKNWKAFLENCDKDLPKNEVIDLIHNYHENISKEEKINVIICSGRGEEQREKTTTCLKENFKIQDKIFMRRK